MYYLNKLLFENIYIWFVLKFTLHNHVYNYHFSPTNDVIKQIIELWWLSKNGILDY